MVDGATLVDFIAFVLALLTIILLSTLLSFFLFLFISLSLSFYTMPAANSNTESSSSDPLPPEEFLCSLTKELMQDPLVSRYGYHFERKAIVQWLSDGNPYCPMTGNPLRISNLVSDKTLQWKIQYWAKKHGQQIEIPDDHNDPGEQLFHEGGGGLCATIPDAKFLCPLTKEIMKDPVMSKTGYNFEREAILKYLEDMGQVCPITKQPLFPSDFVSNGKLKWDIGQWQLKYGDGAQQMTKLELETKISKAVMVSKDYHIGDILRALTEIEVEEDDKPAAKEEANVLDVLDEVCDTLDA
jgi:hypothetical protein